MATSASRSGYVVAWSCELCQYISRLSLLDTCNYGCSEYLDAIVLVHDHREGLLVYGRLSTGNIVVQTQKIGGWMVV